VADRRDAGSGRPLYGLTVGVKDIFDTAGVPTEYGSPIFAGHVPRHNAIAVRRLEAAGAVVLGKTVTAEFAYFAPGPTTNPWNFERTPGGSSMGSAAAVAARVVPAAIGTQTNGSVIRPAAFCGIVGFKPSAGRLPSSGALRFSPHLDQVGVFATTVACAADICAALAGEPTSAWAPMQSQTRKPVLGAVRTPEWPEIEKSTRNRFESVLEEASDAGADVRELEMPSELAEAIPVHRAIMAAEANKCIRPLVADSLDRCSAQIRQLLEDGAAIDAAEYRRALGQQHRLTGQFAGWAAGTDALLTPSVLGEAPAKVTTGDPKCSTRWTLIGAPAITLAADLSRNRLPLAIQLVGVPGRDRELVHTAGWLESMLPPIGSPSLPPTLCSDELARFA
jgi:Asp-tRNA(Asn)/Glu-tRNA(Gln) amidotransferase A subunit family amidase